MNINLRTTLEEELDYWMRLERVQKRYIDRDFVCRKGMSEKRSGKRDILYSQRKEDDLRVLKNIQDKIKQVSNRYGISK
jgi:hypothetical protein